jgi:GNAT superfamily N-acetyltransferase
MGSGGMGEGHLKPRIALTDEPPLGAHQKIQDGLRRFNREAAGESQARPLAVLLSDPDTGNIVGGLWGATRWGYLHIDLLFIPEFLRRQRLGSKLIGMAEDEAFRRGCHVAWVGTYEFQARGFYERQGYTVFGQLDGPAPVYPSYFLKKTLAKP